MRRQDSQRLVVRRIAFAVVVLLAAGCGGHHHLADYQFSNRTLALVYVDPPSPQLLHGYGDIGISQTAVQWAQIDLPSARDWVEQLPDGPARRTALQQVQYKFAETDPQAGEHLAQGRYLSSRLDLHSFGRFAGPRDRLRHLLRNAPQILAVERGKDTAAAQKCLDLLSAEQRQQVRTHRVDMGSAYPAACAARLKNSRAVTDRFHVAKRFNEVVDAQRKN